MSRFSNVLALLVVAVGVTAMLAFPTITSAQGFTAENTGLTETARSSGYDTDLACLQSTEAGGCIPVFIGYIVNALLGVFGALFLVLIIYGGFQYMVSQGESKKVENAVGTIRNAVIGLVIVVASYAIADWVLNAVTTVSTEGAGVNQTTTPPPS